MEVDRLEPGSMRLSVLLRLVRTEDGGRGSPVFDGYRPHWSSDAKPDQNDAAVALRTPDDSIEPGNEALAVLLPLVPEYWVGRVKVGDTLVGAEGTRVVAEAVVHGIDIGEVAAEPWWPGERRPSE